MLYTTDDNVNTFAAKCGTRPVENLPALALDTLAVAINAEHDAAENHARKAIEHARAAGDKLLLAKARIEHGQWLPWLAANCPRLSIRRSQEYARIAREWPALQAKYADSAHLTIDAALALLAAPAPEPEPLPLSEPPAPASEPQQDSLLEKINREHLQCQAKAREAARHELTLGKMLLAVKASMNDDQWAEWLAEQQQSGAMTFSVHEATASVRGAFRAKAEADDLVERLKRFYWFNDRENLVKTLATLEQAREVRRHWVTEYAACEQRNVARLIKELPGNTDMPSWLQVNILSAAIEKADMAARRVKTWPLEPGESDRRTFFEQAKALLATTEAQS